MKRAGWLLLYCFLSACAVGVREDPAAHADSDPQRLVVITVRNAGSPPAARAGSSPRDYGAPLLYGVAAPTRAAIQRIAAQHSLRAVAQWPIAQLGVYCVVYRIADGQVQSEVLNRLRADPLVESAQPLNEFATLADGYNDPYARLQRSLPTMGVLQAHTWSRGRGVTIAVIDTPADVKHADLIRRNVQVHDVSGVHAGLGLHGTAVTGVIAATPNNLVGIVGVAPEAKMISLAACWPKDLESLQAVCNSFTLARALAAAIELKADVVNLSLGGPSDPLLARLVEHGMKRGMIFVGALPAVGGLIGFPCELPGVLAVAAVGRASDHPGVLFAPGSDVLTLLPNDRYDFLSGSSFAAANVSASVALLLAQDRRRRVDEIRQLLAGTSHGGGSINVCAALAGVEFAAKCNTNDEGAKNVARAQIR
jgi:hypothetical protein